MPHYYSPKQDSEFYPAKIVSHFHSREFIFYSASGVFSKGKVDRGTALLAERMILNTGDKVLDIGCGIGILGIVAASLGAKATMSDVNERAAALAGKNAALNGISDATIVNGDLYNPIKNHDFDVILSNPPQSAGKQVCFALIEGALSHLKKGGALQLVARPNKGGKTLAKKMEEVFGNVSVVVKKSGFAVYLSRKV